MRRVTEKEVLVDNLLLLYLIKRVHDKSGRYLGMTKLQKLVFIAEKDLNQKRTKAFNYDFFAWNYGPLSKEIYLDHEKLVENDLVGKTENITLSKRGKDLFKDLEEIFVKNREILEDIDKVVEKFADFNTNSLVRYVHDLEIEVERCEEPVKIGSLNKGADIISKIDEEGAEKTFEIDDAWIETLEILMDKEFCKTIKESEMDAIGGRTFQLQEVL